MKKLDMYYKTGFYLLLILGSLVFVSNERFHLQNFDGLKFTKCIIMLTGANFNSLSPLILSDFLEGRKQNKID